MQLNLCLNYDVGTHITFNHETEAAWWLIWDNGFVHFMVLCLNSEEQNHYHLCHVSFDFMFNASWHFTINIELLTKSIFVNAVLTPKMNLYHRLVKTVFNCFMYRWTILQFTNHWLSVRRSLLLNLLMTPITEKTISVREFDLFWFCDYRILKQLQILVRKARSQA